MRNLAMQRGNVLFILLLCVVLFAALSMAVMQGFRGNNQRLSQQRIQALATDIISFASNVEKGVQRIQARGVSETRLSFEATGLTGYALSPVATAREQVFNSAGGGANYIAPFTDALDKSRNAEVGYSEWYFTGWQRVEGIGSDAANGGDLVVLLPYVRKDVCIAINKMLNVTNPSGNPPQDFSVMNASGWKYTGSYAAGWIDTPGGETTGKKAACIQGSTEGHGTATDLSGRYYFYYVLLPR